jgi:hypothetical protein
MKRFKNPLAYISAAIFCVVSLLSFSSHLEETNNLQKTFFTGDVRFNDSTVHKLTTFTVDAHLIEEKGKSTLILSVVDEKTHESVYVKLYDVLHPGTFFIPGDKELKNVGNLIQDINQYRDITNFYQATLPNITGLQDGVGRVNITKLTSKEVEGELVLFGNNSEGMKARIESAKFRARL